MPTRNSIGFARGGEGSASFNFAVFDLAGSIRNIGFTGLAEAFETSAGTNAVNGDVASVAFLLEEFRHALGKREHGGGTSGDDVASRLHRGHTLPSGLSVGAAVGSGSLGGFNRSAVGRQLGLRWLGCRKRRARGS